MTYSESRARLVKLLTKGLARIRKGWHQGSLYRSTPRGRVVGWCAVGAVDMDYEARNALRDAVHTNRALAEWNDAKGRTKRQVVAAFTKAIAVAKGRAL